MNRPEPKFSKPNLGSALSVRCLPSLARQGFGKKNRFGFIDFYFPAGSSDSERDSLLIDALVQLCAIRPSQIEIVSSKNNKLIVSFLDLTPEKLNNLIEQTQA